MTVTVRRKREVVQAPPMIPPQEPGTALPSPDTTSVEEVPMGALAEETLLFGSLIKGLEEKARREEATRIHAEQLEQRGLGNGLSHLNAVREASERLGSDSSNQGHL